MIDWIEPRAEGIYCVPANAFLDPCKGVSRAIVSHAHGDHYPRYCGEVHATPETLAIGELRYGNAAAKSPQVHPYGHPFQVGPVTVTFLPAGHILGSAQVLLQYEGKSALYTGDIGFDENPTCAPLQRPQVPIDLLICESTFGEKENHPAPEDALRDMMAVAGKRHVIIGTYALGKAQRINRIISDLRPELPVFVDSTIIGIHSLYRKWGVDPGRHVVYKRQDAKRLQTQYVWLMPPQKMTGFFRDREYYKVFASGWDKSISAAWLNGQLEISDHASQSEIEAYVLDMKPKQVKFWHGYPEPLIRTCQAAGIAAGTLSPL